MNMATNVDKNTCSICLNNFNQPKLINCHHTFCLMCLEDYVKQYTSGTFPCPLCRRQTTIPTGGVKSFTSNFYIDTMSKTEVNMSDACVHHKEKKAELYCMQCFEAVCGKCFGIKHSGHYPVLDLESEDTLKKVTQEIITNKAQLTVFNRRLHGIEESLKGKYSELTASTKYAHDKIEAISEKQQTKLDVVNFQIQQLSSDVTSVLIMSDEITSNSSIVQGLNVLKFSKQIIEKQYTDQLPVIPEILFPVFNDDCTTVVLPVTQIEQRHKAVFAQMRALTANTASNIGFKSVEQTGRCYNFNSTFNLKDFKDGHWIRAADTKIIEGFSWCLAARYIKNYPKLGLFLELKAQGSEKLYSCCTCISITLHSKMDSKSRTREEEYEFNGGRDWSGWWKFINWDELVDPANEFIRDKKKLNVSATLRIKCVKMKR